jgi:hypothetical protein
MHTKFFCSESLKVIDHLKDLGVDGRITLMDGYGSVRHRL